MTQPDTSGCLRPMVRVLGDAAYCNACGAGRGELCRRAQATPPRSREGVSGCCSATLWLVPIDNHFVTICARCAKVLGVMCPEAE